MFMQDSVIQDIRTVLNEAITAIQTKNYSYLGELSMRLNHSITIFQNKEIAICPIVIYSLSKVFDKPQALQHNDFNKFRADVIKNLKFAAVSVLNNEKEYFAVLESTENMANDFSNKLKLYSDPLYKYARSVLARRAIEHGLSLNSAADIFDIPAWELSKQMGQSNIPEDYPAAPRFNKERFDLIRRVFNIR